MGWFRGLGGGRVGDDVLDTLNEALQEVKEAYIAQFGEPPSETDVAALLSLVLDDLLGYDVRVSLQKDASGEPSGRLPRTGIERPLRSGDVLAIQLRDGRFGAARVLDVRRGKCIVEALTGVHPRCPTLDEAQAQGPLRELSFKNTGEVLVLRVVDRPPGSASLLGELPVSGSERRTPVQGIGDWEGIADAILGEWRWEHDREAYVEDVQEERRRALERYKRGE